MTKNNQPKKNEDISEVLGDIGHDFNNLLTSILASLRLVGQQKIPITAQEHVDKAIDLAVQGADLTYDLLAFSQKQDLKSRIVEPNEVARTIEPRLKKNLGATKTLTVRPFLKRLRIFVDPIQFEKSLVALCTNSCEAIPAHGNIMIRISECTVDGSRPGEEKYEKGDYVLIEVEDDGIGMSKEGIKKAFDPLYTTKKQEEGAGAGLSNIAGFVEQSKGYLRIESKLNRGTTVKIFLPPGKKISEHQPGAESLESVGDLDGKGKTVLFVEDDITVLKIVGAGLTAKNYHLLLAKDGEEAINILRAEKHIDLLITDVFLPQDLSGIEVAEKFHRRFPNAGIIYCSGYHEDVVRKKLSLGTGGEVISKPFEMMTLLATMARILKNGKDAGAA